MPHHPPSDDYSAARRRASNRRWLVGGSLLAGIALTLWLVPDWPRWKLWLLLVLALGFLGNIVFNNRCPRCRMARPNWSPQRCPRCGALLYHKLLM